MVEKVIEFSSKNIFLTIILSVILTALSIFSLKNISLDALPDLSPPQVILQVSYAGQSPKIIEEQVSYPLISSLMSLPNIKTIRAMSSFQNALIYIIFKDDTDIYTARSRILEQLSSILPTLPDGAKVSMGPDATGVGWAYQYILKSNKLNLSELRDYQDYYLKYGLLGVDGVSEIAAVGGFVKNYQLLVDQDKMIKYNIGIDEITNALKKNNQDRGGGVLLDNGYEKIIQARGYASNIDDIENITLKVNGVTPIKLKDIGEIAIVPSPRRGIADFNGEGEVVGGIVLVRYKENPYEVIKKIKAKIESLKSDDVEIVTAYDRSKLIDKAIDTLKNTLIEESIIVIIITALFLFHFRSALVVVIILPLTVLLSFWLMTLFDIGSNIMSLGGIAIAIGAMVDASIVMIENAHKHLSKSDGTKSRVEIIIDSSKQVGRPIFFALILIVVSFLPIFALEGQEARLFSPLAYTKTFAMLMGAMLSITLVPVLMILFVKGDIKKEENNYINRFFIFLYTPLLKLFLKIKYLILLLSIIAVAYMYPLYNAQKWEFMPQLNEQDFMYMPVTPYGISIELAKEITQETDKIIKSFPEVDTVFGKAGRADSATDPAPLAMIETIITFKDKSLWREGMTYEKLMSDMEAALKVKGLINSWTYPIRGRIDMLLTGIRTPLGIKLYGDNNKILEEISSQIEQKLKTMPLTLSVSADKSNSGYFLDIDIKQESLSRYGLQKQVILDTISLGVGGLGVSTFIDGLKRHPISIRVNSEQRENIDKIKELKVKTKSGFLPINMFADIKYTEGPSVIKSEKGMKVSFVYITPKSDVSVDEYKSAAKNLLQSIDLPKGYYYEFAGQSEYLESAKERLSFIVPIVLISIFVLIYFALKDAINSLIVFLTLPFAVLGGLLYIDYLGFNLSVAVIVGFLALLGIAAETAIVMVIYLEEAIEENISTHEEAIIRGSAGRLRPKLMTVFAILGGLVPIMYIHGVGSEVMQRIAAPMIGGIVTSAILTLLIIPLLYSIRKR
ncbi:MAG: cation transporter [Sulfurimonas sp. RIFOXYD12_FULL_33_39]|uniref:efflux RND transporter permease subunit n=1 Tax=unclassified Sulfurimonas TaxID=2623549 RepID=UPI0008AB105A|nr:MULTISPECIES: CusA/CzcA family heavy metal efflux RND transporter [unclassified Sulfurimonas]OHE08718.1 MAG: cation transporter [Sulfurimonas sp. RIFOXYD12_FULL_33_39]OHE14003.1 MAG: cation transporter [Sulfurimonas sp. RIFOXYD2_FULL_34_21]DAB27590.1 MAG TPA: CusA/CzcA family heavy metal efflux RND transporter [Sulfurimonas sp. UBA10385]